MNQEIPGVLSVEGHADQSIPLVLDSPHSGTHYPSDFAHQADPALLRQAEDTHVHTLWRGALTSGAVLLHALSSTVGRFHGGDGTLGAEHVEEGRDRPTREAENSIGILRLEVAGL